MLTYLIVGCGAFFGGAMRHGVNQLALRQFGAGFPVGTLAVNVLGSLAMGLIAGYFALRGEAPQSVRLFLATGILGGFTTFSAFSLDAMLLIERNEWVLAGLYVAASVGLSLLGLAIGLAIVKATI